jgi:hypothetical protein
MLYRVFKVMLFAAVLAAAVQSIRLLLVEPDEMAQACMLDAQQWHCQLRMLAIKGFVRHLYGPVSLIAALLAWLGDIRLFAMLAMLAGMAGVVLYDFELSALGLMLGALLLVRDIRTSMTSGAPVIEQQSHSNQ